MDTQTDRGGRPIVDALRPRVEILTFGCRVNQYESDTMSARLAVRHEIHSEADVYVLNACTVTALAERKARQAARRIRRDHPGALIVVVGCLAEAVERGLTRFPDADLLAGNAWKSGIEDVVGAALAGTRGMLENRDLQPLDCERSSGPFRRVRAVLKIQDGCSLECTYCRPTQVRGASRSKSIAAVLREARDLLERGFGEMVLTGINLAQYAPSDGDFAGLVSELSELPGLLRLRIASINPGGLSAQLLDAWAATSRACPHFHVPLQSGDDRILASMQRGYTKAGYLSALDRVRDRIPDATFGSDVIVGFPGEDDRAFLATCDVVQTVGYVNLHVFRYSPRSGTVAAELPGPVPEEIKRERAASLNSVWIPIRDRLLDSRVGSTQDVLVEARRNERWYGYTADYIPVSFASEAEQTIGSVRTVRIVAAIDGRLEGVGTHRANAG